MFKKIASVLTLGLFLCSSAEANYRPQIQGIDYYETAVAGGGTSSGSSGDIQYNDGSNGFGAETALNYDAAINTLYADIFSASGSSGKITGNTYGEYLDFLSGGDGIITLGGDGSGGTARTIKINLDGTTSIVPSQSAINLYSSYVAGQGLNIFGHISAGNTAISQTALIHAYNAGINSASDWIGVNAQITQAGAGRVTGSATTATHSGTAQIVAGNFEAVRSGTGSASNNIYSLLGKSTFTGTGTQTLVMGTAGYGLMNNAGGTITNFYGLRGEDATVTAGTVTYNYAISSRGKMFFVPQTQTIADNGNGGTAATGTITVTSGVVRLTCNDAQGCDMTLSESGILDGTKLEISNGSANVCNFSDTSGVTELAGSFAMGQYDSLSLTYHSDRWVEDARSDN